MDSVLYYNWTRQRAEATVLKYHMLSVVEMVAFYIEYVKCYSTKMGV